MFYSRMTIVLGTLFLIALSTIAKASSEEEGKELYLSYGCAVCHGKNGEGNGISSQKFYPPPTNFHDPKKYSRGNDKDSIRYSIVHGIKEENSVMPAFRHIPKEELDKMIAFLVSLQKQNNK